MIRTSAGAALLAAAALLNIQSAAAADRFTIDRYLNIRAASSPRLSPDDHDIAFLTNITGTNQIWRVPVTGGWPVQLTTYEDAVSGFAYSPVDARIAFVKAQGGDEQGQIYLLSADGADITPLVVEDGITHFFGGWSYDGTKIAYTSNARDKAIFDPYILDLSTGKSTRVYEGKESVYAGGFSPKDHWLLLRLQPSNIDQTLMAYRLDSGEVVNLTPHDGDAIFNGAGWTQDEKTLYVTSDMGRDFINPGRIDLATKKLTWLGDRHWDTEGVQFSFDGTRLATLTNVEGAAELELFDGAFGGATLPVPDLPDGLYGAPQYSRDDRMVVFSYQNPTRPNDVYTWVPETKTLTRVTFSNLGGIPAESFQLPQLVHYPTFDGRQIPADLFVPADLKPGDHPPCLVMMHGGPEGQERPAFSGVWQYFLSRGYAILAPNVRGSTGYGKAYQHLDDIEKREDSVKDMAAGVEWLKAKGLVDADRVAVMGGSYGGYMVLAGLTLYPELFSAGIDIVGIANWVTFLEKTSSYRRRTREVEYGFLDKDRDLLARISPIAKVDRITAPLMVIQGANDPRVPANEAEQIVAAVKSRGGDVEYLLYPDEGHGLTKLKNRIEAYPKVADFLDRHVKNKVKTRSQG